MESVSLYRKYRPQNFDNLIGQDHIKTTLQNALKSERVAHAYLFTGPRGTGKTTSARLMAKALNCTALKDGFEPCDECEICNDINSGRLIDLVEIDAASNRGIDEVRDLKEKINFAPSHAKYKVYIIDEVHMMTNEAFNALLKTLEEPPAHAYFILATTEVHKIPATIISRCQRFDFRRIADKAILARLNFIARKEGIQTDQKALELIAKYVNGGMRDAIGLLEQLTSNGEISFENVYEILGVSDLALLDKLFEFVDSGDTKQALQAVHDLYSQGSDLQQFLHEFIDLLRKKMLESVENKESKVTGKILEMINIFQDAFDNFNESLPQLSMEIAVIKATGAFEKVHLRPVQIEKVVEQETVQIAVDEPEPESEPEPEPEPQPMTEPEQKPEEASQVKADTKIEAIVSKWPRVTERIQHPSLRMSLKNAKPVKLEDVTLTLQFSSNFHKNQVMGHDNRVELEDALKETCGHAFKLVSEVKEIEIKPIMENEVHYVEPPTPPAQETAKKDAVADQALQIFGGEFVD